MQQGVVGGVLDVEDDRFLAAVEPDEPGALAIHHMIVKPREIALRPLDLDDARARVGEPAGGEGRGDGLLDRDHQEACERPFGSLAHRRAASARSVGARHAKPAARLRSNPPVTQLGGEAVNALTFKLDKSPGAGQRCLRKSVAVPVKRRTSRPRPSHAPGMARGSRPPNSSARGGAGSPNGPEWRVLDWRRRAFENAGATTARMIHRGSR